MRHVVLIKSNNPAKFNYCKFGTYKDRKGKIVKLVDPNGLEVSGFEMNHAVLSLDINNEDDKRVYEFLGNKLETKYSKEVIDYEKIIKKRENTAYDKGAWSNDEDLRLLNFYNKGIPIQGIVNIMNREPSDLRRRIKKILKKLS